MEKEGPRRVSPVAFLTFSYKLLYKVSSLNALALNAAGVSPLLGNLGRAGCPSGISENTEIDETLLKELMGELQEGELDIDLTGFTADEVSKLLGPSDTDIDPPVTDDEFDVQ